MRCVSSHHKLFFGPVQISSGKRVQQFVLSLSSHHHQVKISENQPVQFVLSSSPPPGQVRLNENSGNRSNLFSSGQDFASASVLGILAKPTNQPTIMQV